MRIKWETNGALGSYRNMDEIGEDIDIQFIVLPDMMNDKQKRQGIFAKFLLSMPYSKDIQVTVGVEKTADEKYNGFKFRLISTSDGRENIRNPIPFEILGSIFQTLHNSIIDTDGNIHNQAMLDYALDFAEASVEAREEYRKRSAETRRSLSALRQSYAQGQSTLNTAITTAIQPEQATENAGEEMASAVE